MVPKFINENWLAQQKQFLKFTIKTLDDGSPNPNYERLKQTIEAASVHLKAKQEIIRAATSSGMRRNSYDGTCQTCGKTVKPLQGFIRKDKGKWRTVCTGCVIDQLQLKIPELPELEN